jgi:general secretion pathway protein L
MFNLDSALGIEIWADRLTLVSMKRGLSDYTIQNHLTVEGFRELTGPNLVSEIRKFTTANGFNRENIVVGLPRDHVVIREVEFPLDVEENLESVLQFQVEKFEPAEEEKSYYDFQIIERDEETRRIVIQLAMVRQTYVDDYLRLFRELELFPSSITYSGLGYLNLISSRRTGVGTKDNSLVIRIEPGQEELLAFGQGRLVSSQAIQVDDSTLTAEGLLEQGDAFVSGLEGRIGAFSKVYLTGQRAPELLDGFASRLGKEVDLLNSGVELKRQAISRRELDRLLPATGLAISRFEKAGRSGLNLIPIGERVVTSRASLVPTLVLGCVFILLVLALGTREYFQFRGLEEQVDGQVQGLESQVNEAFRLRDQVTAQRAELEELKSLMNGRQRALLILKDLTERIPDDAYLQNVQLQAEQLTMQGYSDQASRLPPILLESEFFESVKTNWITTDPRRPGKERFSFAATLRQ